jgi:hypothetical protein
LSYFQEKALVCEVKAALEPIIAKYKGFCGNVTIMNKKLGLGVRTTFTVKGPNDD